jgi:hypothetical protein
MRRQAAPQSEESNCLSKGNLSTLRIGWGLAAKIGDGFGWKNHCGFLTGFAAARANFATMGGE